MEMSCVAHGSLMAAHFGRQGFTAYFGRQGI